jgi:hypothetical protein
MLQVAVLDGLLFDAPPLSLDGFAAPKVDVGWGKIANALVGAVGVAVVNWPLPHPARMHISQVLGTDFARSWARVSRHLGQPFRGFGQAGRRRFARPASCAMHVFSPT